MDDFSQLTQWLRIAGDVIAVNPQLRPQILESLRLQLLAQKRQHLLFNLLLLAVVGGSLLGLRSTVDRFESPPFVTAAQLQQRALQHADQTSQSLDWSLLEVFAQQRELALSGLRQQLSGSTEVLR